MSRLIQLTAILLIFGGGAVLACTCGETPSVADAREAATAVFMGVIVSSEYQKGAIYLTGKDAGEELAVRFKVERWWKGNPLPEVILFTEQYRTSDPLMVSVSTCGFPFVVGKRYLVYTRFDGKLKAAYCSRTSDSLQAKEDIKLLGRGQKPKRSR